MSDYEPRLRDALQRAADAAPTPALYEAGLTRRVRMRSFMRVAVAAMVVVVLGSASVVAGDRLFSAPKPKPANQDESIGQWTRSLYVLDPNNLTGESYVNVLAETGGARRFRVRTYSDYSAGYDPQITLSPDGSRLYVMSTLQTEGIENRQNVIDIYDTRTGARLSRATLPELDGTNKDRTLHKLPVVAPDFVSSLDGSRLYLGENTIRRGPVRPREMVGTFDTATRSLLPNSIEIPDCNWRVFLPGPSEDALSVVCSFTPTPTRSATVPRTNFVYFLEVAGDGSASSLQRLDLPRGGVPDEEVAWAAATADGGTIYAVTRSGHVYVIDAETRSLRSEHDLEPRLKVQSQKVALSPDGSTLYVGTAPLGSSSIVGADEIAAYDTTTWRSIATVAARDFFWTMTLGPGGHRIYAPTFDESNSDIQVFDARTLEQLTTLKGLFRGTPALIEVPRLGR